MASAARRPEGFVRSNRREGAETRDAPSGLEVLLCDTCEASANAVCGSLSDLATKASIPATGEAVNPC